MIIWEVGMIWYEIFSSVLTIWIELFVAAGEMLHVAEAFIDKSFHPTVICRGNCDESLVYYYNLSLVVHGR